MPRERSMGKDENLKWLMDCGLIPVIRARSPEIAVKVANATNEGGVNVVEISFVTPDALEAIRTVIRDLGGKVLAGAGTVLDAESARAAILAGAEFIVSPTLNRGVIEVCRRYSKISIPGALTPTEILTAWELGADIVKVFPASLGGPRYIRDLLEPLPQLRLLPTGGIGLENAGEFIKAGAVAIAVGGALVDRRAVEEGRFDIITENARKFMEAVGKARAS